MTTATEAQTIKETETGAEANARTWAEQIDAWVDAIDFCGDEDAKGGDMTREARAVLREYGYRGTNRDETREAIEEAARESPLCVDVRSGWQSPGEALKPEEFQILLSTGGPALRVVGRLGEAGQPIRPRLEHQDWGTPWTWWRGACPGLESFCALFFFGE